MRGLLLPHRNCDGGAAPCAANVARRDAQGSACRSICIVLAVWRPQELDRQPRQPSQPLHVVDSLHQAQQAAGCGFADHSTTLASSYTDQEGPLDMREVLPQGQRLTLAQPACQLVLMQPMSQCATAATTPQASFEAFEMP